MLNYSVRPPGKQKDRNSQFQMVAGRENGHKPQAKVTDRKAQRERAGIAPKSTAHTCNFSKLESQHLKHRIMRCRDPVVQDMEEYVTRVRRKKAHYQPSPTPACSRLGYPNYPLSGGRTPLNPKRKPSHSGPPSLAERNILVYMLPQQQDKPVKRRQFATFKGYHNYDLQDLFRNKPKIKVGQIDTCAGEKARCPWRPCGATPTHSFKEACARVPQKPTRVKKTTQLSTNRTSRRRRPIKSIVNKDNSSPTQLYPSVNWGDVEKQLQRVQRLRLDSILNHDNGK
jgi:hypothetical protein